MRIALACALCVVAAGALAAPGDKDSEKAEERKQASQSVREEYRARLNQNVVTIMGGTPGGTEFSIAADIAQVVDDGDNLRVLPIVGKGVAQNVKDVMFLRGIDMGITQANVLKHFARTGELGPNLASQLVYVAKLFNEEIHIVARSDIRDIEALEGQLVNFGLEGSGTDITGGLVLDALGIKVRKSQLADTDAIEKLKTGEIAAAIVLSGKPAPVLASVKRDSRLKLLSIPYAKGFEEDYYPATLTHADYPQLVPEGKSVDTIAVCAVLVSFNWSDDSVRYKRMAKFVDAFFSKFDEFLKPPRHPKWSEVNFAATLEDWQRSPNAEAWIKNAEMQSEIVSRSSFDSFLAETAAARGASISDAERSELFRAFLEWRKARAAN